MGDVDEETLVRGDGRGEGVEDGGEGWDGSMAEFVAWGVIKLY